MNIFQNNLEEKIASIIAASVQNLGYELVRVKISGSPKHHLLQIMFDRVDGAFVNIDDCKKLHYAVSPILDVEDIIEGRYTLEISSPGLNRPLTRDKDLIKYTGHAIKLTTKLPIADRRRFIGVLHKFSNDELELILQDTREIIMINKNNIMKATLIFKNLAE